MQNYIDTTAPYTALVIIGGGPAGMAAAVAAYDDGVRDMVILERDLNAGGILRQCIHNGFGLHRFGEELTGPEYADRYHKMALERGISIKTGATVLDVTPSEEEGIAAYVTAISEAEGMFTLRAGAVVLAMGCRERSKGALNIAGTRPAGIFSAGTAQRFVNMEGYMPGRKAVILGSGDIGLIMARRMTLEGAQVQAVCELMPYSGGLARNITQCLDDFGIPLMLSHTVTQIHGKERLTGVTVSKVDERRRPIPGSEIYFECDTLLLSVGLIPENELTRGAGIGMDGITGGASVDQYRQTSLKGVFACGNVLHVHDLVDYVSEEAAQAGKAAAEFAKNGAKPDCDTIPLIPTGGVRYTVPVAIRKDAAEGEVTIRMRVDNVYQNKAVCLYKDGERLVRRKKMILAPGEMETVKITADMIAGNESGTFRLSLEEV